MNITIVRYLTRNLFCVRRTVYVCYENLPEISILILSKTFIYTPLNKGILCRQLLTIYAYIKMFTTNIDENERFVVVISLGVD